MKSNVTLLLLLFICIPGYSQMQQMNGPYAWGFVDDIKAFRGNSNIVFASNYDGVFKSEDKGATWTKVSNQTETSTIEVCGSNSNYVITDKERSTDGGQSWMPNSSYASEFRFKPGSTSVLYKRYSSEISKSTDFGATWTQLTIPGGSSVYQIEVDYNSPSYLYVLRNDSLKRSTNEGANWTTLKVVTSGSSGLRSLAISPASSNTIYVGGSISSTYYLFKSTNGGANFTQIATGFYMNNISVDIQNPNILYSGYGPLHKSTDGGTTWFITGAQQFSISNLCVTPTGQIYTEGDYVGALISEDKCASFKSIGPLFSEEDLSVLAIDNNVMYAWQSSLYKTTNGGTTWFPMTDQIYGQYEALAVSPANSNKLYMCSGGSINISTDAGATWTNYPISTGTSFSHLWVNRVNEQIIFVQSWSNGTVSKTTNGGVSWSIVNLPVAANGDYYKIRLSQTDANVVFYVCPTSSAIGKVFKSTNLGSTWTELTIPLGAYDNIVDLRTTAANKVILSARSVFISNDQGNTWTKVYNYGPGGSVAINDIYVNPGNSNSFYSYYYQGGMNFLCGTSDGGATWFDAHTGIPRTTQYIYEGSLSSGGKLFVQTDKYLFAGIPVFAIGINTISTKVPVKSMLYDNYPNPFNPSTTIKFDLANGSNTAIIVYDVMGQEITKLVNEVLNPGTYSVDWNSSSASSGVYFYRLVTDNYIETKKMILVK